MRRRRTRGLLAAAIAITLGLGALGCADAADGSFVVGVASMSLGERAGFGAERLPGIILGPPRGGGLYEGSLDTLSLGVGGSIVVEMGRTIVDGPGADFIVFENAFNFGGTGVFAEPAFVSVSADGEHFTDFPCAPETTERTGCAGIQPVFANAGDNDIDPTDPASAGGDAFDLSDIGVGEALFIRIVDAGVSGGLGTDNAGFDLDAVSVVNGD